MASKMYLIWGSGSIPCWRPMLVLEEKGLQCEKKLISFDQKEHKGEDVIKLNPRGQVPTFKDGDVSVNESLAICDYLEYKYGDQGTRLLPIDSVERGKVLQRMHECQNLIKKMNENIVFYFFRTKPEDRDQKYLDEKRTEAREELKLWENYLKEQGDGTYVVGKNFTMADVFFFPEVAFSFRSKLNLDSFPSIKAYYERVVQRPSVKATWPPHWREGEGSDFFVGV